MSVDQELSKKAYSDYANLDGNSLSNADTTYRNDFEYYGYFDSGWCYTYSSSGYFRPEVAATNHECNRANDNAGATGAWSGNFLNWATMTRMDILRRVLYGGKRSTDSSSQTILERAYLPNDVHAFSKRFSGADVSKYTPYTNGTTGFSGNTQLNICNVSSGGTASDRPIMRIAFGYYPQWAAQEHPQCGTGAAGPAAIRDDLTVRVESCVTNKDDSSQRCRQYGTSALKKPAGLLQKYGEDGNLKFSLTTGSYKGHTKGGVLRVAAHQIASNTSSTGNEIDLTDGTFISGANGIIQNINALKIANYNWGTANNGGQYFYSDCDSPGIPFATVKTGTTATQRCTDWGNPIGEVFLEMLRYISGATSPSTGFYQDDTTTLTSSGSTPKTTFQGVPGITALSTWTDPWTEWCSTCSAIVISTGSNSFDSDDLGSASVIEGLSGGAADVNAKTDLVGDYEAGGSSAFNGNYFAGGNFDPNVSGSMTGFCYSMAINKLSYVAGICPELPALQGSYSIAGLAYHAHVTDLRKSLTGLKSDGVTPLHDGIRNVNTYAIDLAESVPTFKVKVNGQEVSFIPSCQSNNGSNWGSCTMVDVIVENISATSGSFLITWEDSNWGNDFDLDAQQRISYCVGAACNATNSSSSSSSSSVSNVTVGSSQIRITNQVVSAAAGFPLRFSYSIYGVTSASGTFLRSSIKSDGTVDSSASQTYPASNVTFGAGTIDPWVYRPGSVNFNAGAAVPATVGESTIVFTAGSSTAVRPLQKPLWYAAKYGGFTDINGDNFPDTTSEWDNYKGRSDGVPDNFFSVANPAVLEDKLETVLLTILSKTGSASAVATSSTRLTGDQYIYQAVFESKVWTGELRAYKPDSQGQIGTPLYTTSTTVPTPSSRNIYVYDTSVNPKVTKKLTGYTDLNSTQQSQLTLQSDPTSTFWQMRVDWLLGDINTEDNQTKLRSREITETGVRTVYGDIVNSSPTYAGGYDFKYDQLCSGSANSYRTHVKNHRLPAAEPLILVGANDGMVHAFIANSTQTPSSILTEKFAYIPNLIFGKLANLTRPDYGSVSNPHQYLVDGAIAVGDVCLTQNSQLDWHAVAVGSLGAGGKGIYALDITGLSTPTVLFEYTHPDMGYVLGKIFIVPAQDGNWYAVFGNGPGSGTTSKLFMVDIANPTGSNTKILDTGDGVGLSSPTILLDSKGVLTDVYAGDLSGNLWRFDVSSSNSSDWSNTSLHKVYKLFKTDAGQPITATPTIGYNSVNNVTMAYFGTGKYFDAGDNVFSSTVQSFYAIPDLGYGNLVTKSDLTLRSMSTSMPATPGGAASRTISGLPNWSSYKGWYLNMYVDSSSSIGERITNKALLVQDQLIISTLIPSEKTCEAGGQSWLMTTCAICDRGPYTPIVPNLYDDQVHGGDYTLSLLPIKKTSTSSTSAASSASSSSAASGNCRSTIDVALINSGSKGQNLTNINGTACADNLGRQSWRQLK